MKKRNNLEPNMSNFRKLIEKNRKRIVLILKVGLTASLSVHVGRFMRVQIETNIRHKGYLLLEISQCLGLRFKTGIILVYFLYHIHKFIRNSRGKKHSVRCYQSEDIWIDSIPGSRNVDILVFCFFTYYKSFELAYRFCSNAFYGLMFIDFIPTPLFLLPDQCVTLVVMAILSMILSLGGSILFYLNIGSGTNVFHKKNGIVYINRYGLPGKGRFIVLEVPMNDILCVILKTDPNWGDVLYIKTGEQGTLPLTPVFSSCYDFTEKGVELSKFLNVRFTILQSDSEESK